MKISFTILAIILLTNCKTSKKVEADNSASKKSYSFYVGTYTDKESKGIYKYKLDASGNLSKIGLAVASDNPSFLALSADNKYLLAVNEVNKDSSGFIESYAIQNDGLQLINRSSSGGANPCFVGINKEGYVLTANYTGGNMGLLKLGANGQLSPLLDISQHEGKGTTKRQEGPHAHSAWFEKNNENNIIAIDLGTNELWFSQLDASTNKLIPTAQKKLAMAEGAGPRHLTFHPTKNFVYVLNELNNTISTIRKSTADAYELLNTVSILPDGFSAYSKAADIHISNDGKFVYASNRGHDSVAILAVNVKDGSLTLIGHESTKGKNPRNFSISPDGNYIIVANQGSDNLISFKRNTATGLLTFVSEIEAPTPVCILFSAN